MKSDTNTLDASTAAELVKIARRSIELFHRDEVIFHPDLSSLPEELTEKGSSFVTITNHGRLRGCIGSTDSRFALAEDVARNAISSSTRDYRFPSVTKQELPDIRIEVTILTKPLELPFEDYEDLVRKLKPGLHGVILSSEGRKGLLLPQVWDRLPNVDQFLEMITMKAGIPRGDLHHIPPTIKAFVFEAHHYCELGYQEPGG